MLLVLAIRQYVKYRVAPELDMHKLELVTLDGSPTTLSAYAGKHILLTFFATWCGPCHQEIPAMEAARTQLEQAGFVLIHVSDEEVPLINKFMDKNPSGITYLRSLTSREALGVHTIPTHYVFDRQGGLKFKQTNPLDWEKPETVQQIIDMVQ